MTFDRIVETQGNFFRNFSIIGLGVLIVVLVILNIVWFRRGASDNERFQWLTFVTTGVLICFFILIVEEIIDKLMSV